MITSGKGYKRKIVDASSDVEDLENKFTKIRQEVKENILKSYDKRKRRYDLRARPTEYVAGDIVWKTTNEQSSAEKHITAKLLWNIKCRVKKKIGRYLLTLIQMHTLE